MGKTYREKLSAFSKEDQEEIRAEAKRLCDEYRETLKARERDGAEADADLPYTARIRRYSS